MSKQAANDGMEEETPTADVIPDDGQRQDFEFVENAGTAEDDPDGYGHGV